MRAFLLLAVLSGCNSPTGADDALSCGTLGNACSIAADCCGAANLDCQSREATGLKCCLPTASACTTNSDCCGFMSCTGSPMACACQLSGQPCAFPFECCSPLNCVGLPPTSMRQPTSRGTCM